ncbi:MAG: hypothetical protein WCY68_11215 [Desulfuromonadales bacterium]
MSATPDALDMGLTPGEEAAYFRWARELSKRYAVENEILDEVTVSFTFTPLGTYVVAFTGPVACSGHSIVLREI